MSHVDRMLAEKAELDDRILKLTDFISNNPIYRTLAHHDQFLMSEQLNAMCRYQTVLHARISLAQH